MAIIQLDNITFRRDGRDILSQVSWTIEERQHWALLGANGSGKTTLLQVITGYEWPTHGATEVFGKRFGHCNLRELRKKIGWVGSSIEHKLPPNDAAVEIVASGFDASMGLYREFSDAEFARARQALAMLGGEAMADQTYSLLSQGEQQRVLIARSLVNQPALVILDEPCIGLDPAARRQFLDDLGLLVNRAEAPTLLYVTHHIEEIDDWISHALVLKEGKVLARGATSDILTGGTLSEAFGRQMEVVRGDGQYQLRVAHG